MERAQIRWDLLKSSKMFSEPRTILKATRAVSVVVLREQEKNGYAGEREDSTQFIFSDYLDI
jgi:hypothetical protein